MSAVVVERDLLAEEATPACKAQRIEIWATTALFGLTNHWFS